MRRLIERILFVSALVIGLGAPASVRAQDASQDKPADEAQERPTGLPSPIKWTFNFDAGWGTFGFGNSLFNNPKEPGVEENLSDQWFEGYVKPAVSATYTLASSSEIYGKLSAVGERTYGSVPEPFGQDVSSFGPEDLSIGWRSGKSLTIGENALDFTIGRTQYQLGHGFLLFDGAAEGGTRGGYWTNARKAFEFATIGRFKPGAHTVEAFYLDKDELDESDSGSRLWGTNYEFSIGEATTLGATYMKWFAHEDITPGRDGLNVFNLRAYTAPFPSTPDLSFEAEYASERNGEALDSNAWTLQGAYEFSTVGWKPKLSYRYAFFQGDDPSTTDNEAFDPLFLGFYDWGTWWQGEIAGEELPVQLEPEIALGPRALRAERGGRRRAHALQVHFRSAGVGRPRGDVQRRRLRDRCVRGLEGEHQLYRELDRCLRQPGDRRSAGDRSHQEFRLRHGLRRIQLLIFRTARQAPIPIVHR